MTAANVMGALTGVAFGAITSFYFTNQVNQSQITQLKTEIVKKNDSLTRAAEEAKKANMYLSSLKSEFEEKQRKSVSLPLVMATGESITESELKIIVERLNDTSSKLMEIAKFKSQMEE